MTERGLYYTTEAFAEMIKSVGGEWNDTKRRPMVCLVKSTENDNIFWAIPMGNYNHRTAEQQKRLDKYLNLPDRDIRSCYYHLGRTTAKSIFFISDAIPIIDKYIDAEHLGGNNKHYIIKNPKLISELERKLYRILSIENSRNNTFRQHITDVKKHLLEELSQPRQLVEPFRTSENTLNMIDHSMDNLKRGVSGAAVDLSKFEE